jgi:hypothetical protein
VVAQDSFPDRKGVALQPGLPSAVATSEGEADLVFTVGAPADGRYQLWTYAATDERGTAQMKQAKTKFESLFLRIQVGERRSTRRWCLSRGAIPS